MDYKYEFIMEEETLPIRTIIHSVDGVDFHWHNKIEIIFVLEGTVNVNLGSETYFLQEQDIILVNANELHSVRRTKDKNLLLALQIDPVFYKDYYPQFINMRFHCNSLSQKEEDKFNTIRNYIANITWCLNKKIEVIS